MIYDCLASNIIRNKSGHGITGTADLARFLSLANSGDAYPLVNTTGEMRIDPDACIWEDDPRADEGEDLTFKRDLQAEFIRAFREALVLKNEAIILCIIARGAEPSFSFEDNYRRSDPRFYCFGGDVKDITCSTRYNPSNIVPLVLSSPLHIAVFHNHLRVVDALIGKGAGPNEVKTCIVFTTITPLHTAVHCGNARMIDHLTLRHGADLDILDGNKTTPIELATKSPKTHGLAGQLPRPGANPLVLVLDALMPSKPSTYAQNYANTHRGRHEADLATMPEMRVVRSFVEAWHKGDSDLDQIKSLLDDNNGVMGKPSMFLDIPLLKSLPRSLVGISLHLLDRGASATATDSFGNTAFHYAYRIGRHPQYDVLARLVQLGADQDAVNRWGETAMKWARKANGEPRKRVKSDY
ncbi:ankyrin repeat-containing domain protein [Cercophora scortea]|uniref:Ankyrin repeat-containing domain protein n=1 Tax=Cercophora scortea TaxID=314031 RepID=A0AAE0M485_9PEZI|nr:ankyrin repeat-containing domain protein [Cercophora scortea]